MLEKLLDFFKKKVEETEAEDLDPYTGLPKHLVEKQELAYLEMKLMREGREKELEELEKQLKVKREKEEKRKKEKERKKKRPFDNICFSCGFPYANNEDGSSGFKTYNGNAWTWDGWDWDDSFDSEDSIWNISYEISLGIAGIPPYDEIYGFSNLRW